MKSANWMVAHFSAVGIAALSLFFALRAAQLFYGATTGHIREDLLFGVPTCCDIPSSEITRNALSIGACLAGYACVGLLLAGGLWALKGWAWKGAWVWCALVALVQFCSTVSLIESAKGEHFRLVFGCVGLMILLFISSSRFPKPARRGAPDESPVRAPIPPPHD